MSLLLTKLVEIFQLGLENVGVFDLRQKYWPQPGQYLPCQPAADNSHCLPIPLFRVLGEPDQLSLAPIPDHWGPGDKLIFSSPQGHGFELPPGARRVGLIPFAVSPGRLLSLVRPALAQGAEVSLFYEPSLSTDLLKRIPSHVEVLPLSSLIEDPGWPDYLAVDLERPNAGCFTQQVDLGNLQCSGEMLVRTPMPCRGIGACGVCAVHTHRGIRHVCVDGPVFSLEEVAHVAR